MESGSLNELVLSDRELWVLELAVSGLRPVAGQEILAHTESLRAKLRVFVERRAVARDDEVVTKTSTSSPAVRDAPPAYDPRLVALLEEARAYINSASAFEAEAGDIEDEEIEGPGLVQRLDSWLAEMVTAGYDAALLAEHPPDRAAIEAEPTVAPDAEPKFIELDAARSAALAQAHALLDAWDDWYGPDEGFRCDKWNPELPAEHEGFRCDKFTLICTCFEELRSRMDLEAAIVRLRTIIEPAAPPRDEVASSRDESTPPPGFVPCDKPGWCVLNIEAYANLRCALSYTETPPRKMSFANAWVWVDANAMLHACAPRTWNTRCP